MISKILKWGNSLAIRIPMSFTRELKLKENSPVDIKIEKNKIIISPVEIKNYDLKELVSRVSETNIHSEIETGPPQGKEIW